MKDYKHYRSDSKCSCRPDDHDDKYCKCKSKCGCRPDNHDDKYYRSDSKPCSCPSDHKPAQVLTTGPFRVPSVSNNTSTVDLVIIGLKNHTNQQTTVRVTLDRCPRVLFPDTTTEITTFSQRVTLDPHECTQIEIFRFTDPRSFEPEDLLRVTFEGDICKDGTQIEATVVGRDNVGGQEATMFFRHDDLVETCPEHF